MTTAQRTYPRQRRTGAARFLPLLGWLPDYDRTVLRSDVLAGLTVAVMLVPQSMAYAALAGMPAVTGLYASVVPLLVYALWGTSASLAVGPVAIVSLMTAAALGPMADGDPGRYAALAAVLALLVGAMQLTMGALRLGAVVNFLSHPVLSGFTSAAALVIAASQLKDLLGLDAERSESFPDTLAQVWRTAESAHAPTIAIATASVATLLLLRRVAPRLPGALLVVAATTAISAALSLGERDVRILREVPAGLPAPDLPGLSTGDLTALLAPAAAIAIVGYMEGIAVAKSLAAKSRQSVDANGELVAVGGANLSAGLFGAFPVAGGFSRSAVNFSAGARTPFASLITAAAVALTALALTPAFYHLPKAVLGAIVVVAVIGLVDPHAAHTAWRARRSDGLALALTFAVTLVFGVEPGLAVGAAFTAAVFLWRASRPHTAELGRVPGTDTFRNLARYTGLETDPGIAIVRVDGPMFFASAHEIAAELLAMAEDRPALHTLVLDAAAVGDIDADGASALEDLHTRLADRGVTLRLATVRGPVRDLLARVGLWQRMREANLVHAEVAHAVAAAGAAATARSQPPHTPAQYQDVY